MNNNICSYKDHDYKTKFWEGDVKREYEHKAEIIALNKFLDNKGGKLIDIGAGFGRLLDTYVNKYKEGIVLFDYAENLLEEAKKQIMEKGYSHVKTMQGSAYNLPFDDETFTAGLSVRVLHHIENVPAFLKEVNRVLKLNSIFILEYANKRNLLEVVRYFMGKSNMEPLSKSISKRGDSVYYNFHPGYIRDEIKKAGFIIEGKLSVSNFRLSILKKIIPLRLLLFFEDKLQKPLSKITFGPSMFLKIRKVK